MKVAKTVPKFYSAPLPDCKSNTLLQPKVARRYASVGSTNAELLSALATATPPASGDVFLTRAQTAGRGQGTNGWHATPGDNLTLSMCYRPDDLSVDRLFALTQAAALAVAATLTHFLPPARRPDVRIKWPNDVYLGDRKVAGILIQNGLRGSHVTWCVVGIGLNVNEADFPPDLRPYATSLAAGAGERLSVEAVLDRLLHELGYWFTTLETAPPAALDRPYHDRLYLRGQRHRFRRTETDATFQATVTAVDAAGRLLLTHPDGRVEACDLRSIRYR